MSDCLHNMAGVTLSVRARVHNDSTDILRYGWQKDPQGLRMIAIALSQFRTGSQMLQLPRHRIICRRSIHCPSSDWPPVLSRDSKPEKNQKEKQIRTTSKRDNIRRLSFHHTVWGAKYQNDAVSAGNGVQAGILTIYSFCSWMSTSVRGLYFVATGVSLVV